jgi:nicotinamide mononucleotide adenylyltransferase
MNNNVAFFIGRFAPPHKGHIQSILKLVPSFSKIIIGLGSCYEVGSARHPLLAIFREKMMLASLKDAGCDLNNIEIVHIQDKPSFEEWIDHVLKISKEKKVTHFVTGNQEDILGVLKKNNIELPFELINPEENSSIPYHASDLRKAIVDGDYEIFRNISSTGTINLMGNINGFNGIRQAIENVGIPFFKGRQTVDVIFMLSDRISSNSGHVYEKKYLLCGLRPNDKKSFPGWLGLPGDVIKDYESPINATLRTLREKCGINIKLLDNTIEPAHILIETNTKNIIAELKFLKLFSASDTKLSGADGGSSQCFLININESPNIFNDIKDSLNFEKVKFIPVWEAIEQGLAYQQTDMVKVALNQLSLYEKIGD